jgi:outer membrane scaffolding protein for murein synthesis (MipA/OmpV family)
MRKIDPRAFAIAGVAALLVPAGEAAATDFHSEAINLQVGGMVVVAPEYEGSDDYEVVGFPFVAPAGLGNGGGLVQFRGPDDLRFRVLHFGGFEAGPLVGWRFDRDEDDGDRLRGLGDVDGGFVVGGFAAYRLGTFKPFVSYHHQVSGDDTGGLTRFGVEARVEPAPRFVVTGTVGATYADDDYMQSFFGVTPDQSAASASGLGVYDADAGIKDVYIGLSTDVPLSEDWTLKLMGRYARLTGDAADSPIVESEDQLSGGVGFTYKLGRR